MNRQEKGVMLIRVAGIICAAISILTLLSVVWNAKWNFYMLLPLSHICLHIDLWVLFCGSRACRTMNRTALLAMGIVSVALSGYLFVRMSKLVFSVPTLRTGLYMLAFPAAVLFLVGVILRGNSHASD